MSSSKRVLFFISAVLSFLIQITSSAQTKEIEVYELFDVSLEDLLNVGIVSATKKKQSVQDAPATAYVFPRQLIQNRGYSNLLELLNDVPEIEFQNNSDPESRNQITVRGVAGNEKFLVLLNGIRITPATGDGYVLGTNLSLANAQRVEVIIGPASALYGVDAFSGIVNIITVTQEGAGYKGGQLTSSIGQYSTTDNSFVGATKVDKVQFSVAGNYHYSAEPNYNKLYKRDFIWYNKHTAKEGVILESPFYNYPMPLSSFEDFAQESFYGKSLSQNFAMPSQSYFINTDINFSNFSVGYSRHTERHSSAYGVDPKYTTYDKDAFMENSVDVFYGKHNFTSFNKKWGLQTTFTQSYYELNPESHFASAASRWQRGFVYANGQSSKIEEQFNYDFSSNFSLIAGASFERLTALPRTGLSTVPYDKSKPAVEQDLYFVGLAGLILDDNGNLDQKSAIKQTLYNLSYQNIGSYLQLQTSIKKVVQFTLGTRYDYNTRFGGSLNPRAGIVFSPTKNLRIKATYGESFLAPSPKKAYQQSGTFSNYQPWWGYLADYYRIPNPDLSPEKLRSIEGSVSYFITPNLSIASNGYITYISNLIDFYARADNAEAPEEFKVVYLEKSINRGKATIKGITGKVNYLFKVGKFNINTFAAASFTDGQINEYDWRLNEEVTNPLFFTAKINVKSGIDVNTSRLALSSRVNYRSSSYASFRDGEDVVNGERAGFNKNLSFAVLDVFLKYKLWVKSDQYFALFAKVNNATNLKYYHVFTGNSEGFTKTPQDPIRVNLGIDYKF